MGCQAGWPRKEGMGGYYYHPVIGGYQGERIWCCKETYDLPTSGHCSLASSGAHSHDRTVDAAPMASGVYAALDPAAGKDSTVLFTHVTEEDFKLMLEVDMAFIDWLKRRCILL